MALWMLSKILSLCLLVPDLTQFSLEQVVLLLSLLRQLSATHIRATCRRTILQGQPALNLVRLNATVPVLALTTRLMIRLLPEMRMHLGIFQYPMLIEPED